MIIVCKLLLKIKNKQGKESMYLIVELRLKNDQVAINSSAHSH